MDSYLILLSITLLQYTIDPTFYLCSTTRSKIILFIHHIISIYIMFGGFLLNPFYHLIFTITVLIHWITNNNRCQITIINNRECGIDESNQFQDFLQTLNISKVFPNIHWFILPLLCLLDIYRIQKENVKITF